MVDRYDRCKQCGLLKDLCTCDEEKQMASRIKPLGIISPPRVYYCTKCKQHISWSETETFVCPCCGRAGLRHKGECQGTVVEEEFNLPRIY